MPGRAAWLLAVVICCSGAVAGVGAAGAGAAFTAPPVELGHGTYGGSAAAATDAGGATTAVMVGVDGGPQLVERAGPGAPWGAAAPLPGRELGTVAGPVVAAAGAGAGAVAWRIDKPRRYQAIAAFARDPGGAFGAPAIVSPADANGVRHPSVAIDASGRGLLAYNTNTRDTHLSLGGAVAVSLRDAGRAFAEPVVVDDQPSSAPQVAIGPDGKGLVAWVRERRIWAATVDVPAGHVGRPEALTPPGSYDALRVAAGPDVSATVAFVTRLAPKAGGVRAIAALRRPPGGTFAPRRMQVVERLPRNGFLRDLAVAADENGRTTLAWSPERFGRDRSVGFNGVTSTVHVAVAGAGSVTSFGAPRVADGAAGRLCSPPSVAAAAGRAEIAYTCRDRRTFAAIAIQLNAWRIGHPQTVLTNPVVPESYAQSIGVSAGLDAFAHATLVIVRPDPPAVSSPHAPTPTVERVLAVTGR